MEKGNFLSCVDCMLSLSVVEKLTAYKLNMCLHYKDNETIEQRRLDDCRDFAVIIVQIRIDLPSQIPSN